MKYAFMSFSTPESTLTEMIEIARRYGYDGLEPRLDSHHAHGIEVAADRGTRRVIVEQMEAGSIELGCLATSLKFADPALTDSVTRESYQRIDLAADLGAPVLRVFGGQIPEGITRDAAIDHAVRLLASIAFYAGERGVKLCMETHDDWCDPRHVAAVLSRVDHPAIAVNWDIMHPIRVCGYTMDEAFEILKPWIGHVHVHDGMGPEQAKFAANGTGDIDQMMPIGTGGIDHRRALELLRNIDYAGFISGEWIRWEPWDIHLPREIATLRKYEAELDWREPS
ncbi:MAG: sugar phosphate isomerase/epimerase [Spirochaetaceae bacterium]|nr:sugar phosphate isomerase/epimerase [Spirochaetaceae bacterium]